MLKTDSFFIANFEDEELAATQRYYQALIKANSVIKDYKASKIKSDITQREYKQLESQRLRAASDICEMIKEELSSIASGLSKKEIQSLSARTFKSGKASFI